MGIIKGICISKERGTEKHEVEEAGFVKDWGIQGDAHAGKECHSHCQIYQRMGECIMPHEGVFAVVLEGGTIHVGDELLLQES